MVRKDLKQMEVDEDEWHGEVVRSGSGWRAVCRLGMEHRAGAQATAQASGQAARELCGPGGM